MDEGELCLALDLDMVVFGDLSGEVLEGLEGGSVGKLLFGGGVVFMV
jgi:hypothetical protein